MKVKTKEGMLVYLFVELPDGATDRFDIPPQYSASSEAYEAMLSWMAHPSRKKGRPKLFVEMVGPKHVREFLVGSVEATKAQEEFECLKSPSPQQRRRKSKSRLH